MKTVNITSKTILSAAALALLVFLLYLPTVHSPFLWDDKELIPSNAFIQDTSNFRNLFTKKYFDQTIELSYRPVGTFALMANYAVWKDDPAGYRLTSITNHAVNAILLFFVIGMLLSRFAPGITFPYARAFFAAAIFAVHPANTEAINGVTFNEDPLCMMFVLSGLAAFLIWREQKRPLLLIASAACSAFAMLTKETGIMFPAIILVLELLFRKENRHASDFKRIFLNIAPFAIIAAAYLVLRFVIMKNPAEHIIYHEHSVWATFLLTCSAWIKYLSIIVLPIRQCVDYFYTGATPSLVMPVFALSVPCLIIILLSPFFVRRRSACASFGLAWFIMFLLPVSNIIPIGVIMAERYLYIPMAGFLFAVFCMAPSAGRTELDATSNFKIVSASAIAVVLILLFAFSSSRNRVWANETFFWKSACACAPGSAAPYVNLGVAMFDSGRPSQAVAPLRKAISIASAGDPSKDRYGNLYRAYGNLGMVYAQIGRYGEAEQCLREALKINPAYANAHFNLAILGLKASKTDKPIKFADEMERGLQGAPGNMRARLMLAVYYEKSGLREDRLKAAAHYRILAERDSLHRAIFLERAALLDNR